MEYLRARLVREYPWPVHDCQASVLQVGTRRVDFFVEGVVLVELSEPRILRI